MKLKPNPEHLLNDILEECATPEFRDRLLEETLHQVRQRQHARHRNQAFMILAVILGSAFFAMRLHGPRSSPDLSRTTYPQPADSKSLNSLTLVPSMFVASSPATVTVISSSPSRVTMIDSSDGQKVFQEINDPELLALVAGRPVALVRHHNQSPELIFADSADQDGFPVP